MPDSAATATAYLCGVKTNYETIGIDSGVTFNNCEQSKDPAHRTPSMLRWAQEAGKHTGKYFILIAKSLHELAFYHF